MKASPSESQNKGSEERGGGAVIEFMKQEGNHCPGAD